MMSRRIGNKIETALLYIHSFRPLLAHTYTETERMVLTDPDTLTTTADKLSALAGLFEVPLEYLLDDYNRFLYEGQGRQVRELRERMGLSRREFADRLAVWPTTVRDWETDSVRMTKQTWEKLFKS